MSESARMGWTYQEGVGRLLVGMTTCSAGPSALLGSVLFWVRRYLPSELAGTAALLVVGLVVLDRTGSALGTAVLGTLAESVGFYAVALGRIVVELRRSGTRRRLLLRALGLGFAEFAPAELLDTLLVRPLLLFLGATLVPNAAVGLIVGKLLADVVFYVLAASAYRVTDLAGWRRDRAVAAPEVAVAPDLPPLRDQRRQELADRFGRDGLAALVEEHGSPLLLLDPAVAVARYTALAAALPFVRFHYAVKALDHPAVLEALRDAGAWFDVASIAELQQLTACGVGTARMIYSNPIASAAERFDVVRAGVDTVVVDNEAELAKAADLPGEPRILLRLAYRNAAAGIDLSAKFGAERAEAERLVSLAVLSGVPIAGFSFHVGSQLDALEPFRTAIRETVALMNLLEARHGIRFSVLDIGGGFPAAYREPVHAATEIAAGLRSLLEPLSRRLTILAEPGRSIVADAMIAVSTVVGVADRPDGRWVYLDDGLYGSYSNVLTEQVHPLLLAADELFRAGPVAPVTIAGPTCDSIDVIDRGYPMPPLRIGDLVVSPTMGAYTAVTACRFNGRMPARIVPLAAVAVPFRVSA
jgi:ornithine decarboxylase